jgi:hypothetical protein
VAKIVFDCAVIKSVKRQQNEMYEPSQKLMDFNTFCSCYIAFLQKKKRFVEVG